MMGNEEDRAREHRRGNHRPRRWRRNDSRLGNHGETSPVEPRLERSDGRTIVSNPDGNLPARQVDLNPGDARNIRQGLLHAPNARSTVHTLRHGKPHIHTGHHLQPGRSRHWRLAA